MKLYVKSYFLIRVIGGDTINMIQRLRYYADKITELRTQIQSKLDGMTITDANEELYSSREERADALDEIIDALSDTAELIENYSSQWRGLKSIK